MSVLVIVLVGAACLMLGMALTAYAASRVIRRREHPGLFVSDPTEEEVVAIEQTESATRSGASQVAPQPLDPQNPPRFTYYRPKGGYDEARAPKCTCHGIKVGRGEKVLLWPIPGHPDGGYDIFCAETYGVMEP